jgi:hypothetical protein
MPKVVYEGIPSLGEFMKRFGVSPFTIIKFTSESIGPSAWEYAISIDGEDAGRTERIDYQHQTVVVWKKVLEDLATRLATAYEQAYPEVGTITVSCRYPKPLDSTFGLPHSP